MLCYSILHDVFSLLSVKEKELDEKIHKELFSVQNTNIVLKYMLYCINCRQQNYWDSVIPDFDVMKGQGNRYGLTASFEYIDTV